VFIGIHIYLKIIPMDLIGVADQFLQIKLYSLNHSSFKGLGHGEITSNTRAMQARTQPIDVVSEYGIYLDSLVRSYAFPTYERDS
jgi:hypothetical protein